jgi:hypothetical protein
MPEWIWLTPRGQGGHVLLCRAEFGGEFSIQPGQRQYGKMEPDPRHSLTIFTPAEALAFTIATGNWRQVPEVQAIVSDLRESAKICRNRQQLCEGLGDTAADGWKDLAERFEADLVPFGEVGNE